MPTVFAPSPSTTIQTSLALIEELLRPFQTRAFEIRLWEGTRIAATPGEHTRFTLLIKHPSALRQMFSVPTERSLGEAYIFNYCDVEGDIEAAVRWGRNLMKLRRKLQSRLHMWALLQRLPYSDPGREPRMAVLTGRLHSKERDHRAIQYHYNVSSDFFALFLDSAMNYSGAFFSSPNDDLETAQLHKMRRICAALRLQPGDRFLDIGCGWGGLMVYAAQHFGVDALGITLSERQAEVARQRIRAAGLEDRCRVEVRDYRDLDRSLPFDKIASVGMVEHVGSRHLSEYFKSTWSLLSPSGAFLNRGIGRPVGSAPGALDSFTDAYVFPDGELETVEELLTAAEEAGFEVRSTENLGEHYAMTLRHWVHRLENHMEEARRFADEVTYRVWRLYMAGSAEQFSSGRLHLYESLFVKPDFA